jgi:hypothetical protein
MMIYGTQFTWIETDGGPLILLPQRALHEWSGIETPPDRVIEARFRWGGPGSPACDYDRACDIDDYLGTIAVGRDEALVLGDMEMPTAWRALSSDGGLFIRSMIAIDEQRIDDVVSSLPADIWGEPTVVLNITNTPLLLFDSACPGPQIDEFLPVALPVGRFRVQTAVFDPDLETSLVLHLVTPAG